MTDSIPLCVFPYSYMFTELALCLGNCHAKAKAITNKIVLFVYVRSSIQFRQNPQHHWLEMQQSLLYAS